MTQAVAQVWMFTTLVQELAQAAMATVGVPSHAYNEGPWENISSVSSSVLNIGTQATD